MDFFPVGFLGVTVLLVGLQGRWAPGVFVLQLSPPLCRDQSAGVAVPRGGSVTKGQSGHLWLENNKSLIESI